MASTIEELSAPDAVGTSPIRETRGLVPVQGGILAEIEAVKLANHNLEAGAESFAKMRSSWHMYLGVFLGTLVVSVSVIYTFWWKEYQPHDNREGYNIDFFQVLPRVVLGIQAFFVVLSGALGTYFYVRRKRYGECPRIPWFTYMPVPYRVVLVSFMVGMLVNAILVGFTFVFGPVNPSLPVSAALAYGPLVVIGLFLAISYCFNFRKARNVLAAEGHVYSHDQMAEIALSDVK